ncbi:MAG: DUF3854 domain-containing protein [Acidobacteriota bacterium]|nr:DUF3854 domain-containing protein [Acidobacteriota bacterium]
MNNLTTSDYQNFANSFITPEILEAARIRRVGDIEGAEIVGRTPNAYSDYSGVLFPYFLPEQSSPREYRLRRDKPDLEEQGDGTTKEKGKYLTAPGAKNMIYFSPNCRNDYLADVSLPVVITEGEKKALALHRASWHGLSDAADKPKFLALGLSGVWNFRGNIGKTTNASGARQDVKGLIPDFHLIEWKNRKVIILYDANVLTNESVKFALLTLAKTLTEKGATVYLADCPEMPGCNGIDDILGKIEREQNTDEAVKQCLEILEKAQPFKEEKVSQANQILHLAEDIELFHTPDRTAFASIEVGEHFEVHPVNSKSFRDYLSYQFYQTDGKSPSSQALQDAINSLSGKAKFEGQTQDVHIRLASFNGKIYLDLCNDGWQIIEISANGWRVIEAADAPVRFRRAKAMLALPTPTENGDIDKLKTFLNVDNKNLTLILAWLVNCFRPDYPFPILNISGEQGTAKSTATKVLRELVDPSLAPFRSAPRDERDLIIAATNAWICAFDNLSDIPNRLSDGFCRLSTGSGFGTRTLYENDEETIFCAKRPIILNGIGNIASNGDLVDRAVNIKLEVIPKGKRKTERKFWAEFEKEKTSIFSALVSAVSFALKNIEKISLPELPRMADFALWATGAEQGLGLNAGAFLDAYTQNREDAHSIVLEGSVLAEVLQEFFTAKATGGEYKQTGILLKDFLDQLKDTAGENRVKNEDFPKSSKGLRNQIERINPNLREIGIFITFHGRTGGNAKKGASLSLEYTCNQTSPTSPTLPSPQNKAQTGDVSSDVTENAEMSNVTNITNAASNITSLKPSNNNGLAVKSDVSDVSDVALQPYSNGNGKAEYVDIEI